MKIKFLIILIFCILAFGTKTYSQKKSLVDLMLGSYMDLYQLNVEKAEKAAIITEKTFCPEMPPDFHQYFKTDFIDFASLRESGVKSMSFSDSLHTPLKKKLITTSLYGNRGGKKHFGVDFRLEIGDTIFSTFCGMVRISKYDEGYGNVVVIRNYNMSETVYAHLDEILVDINQEVRVGQPIGLGGNTGRSTGPHLHFEIRYKGYPINPIIKGMFLQKIEIESP